MTPSASISLNWRRTSFSFSGWRDCKMRKNRSSGHRDVMVHPMLGDLGAKGQLCEGGASVEETVKFIPSDDGRDANWRACHATAGNCCHRPQVDENVSTRIDGRMCQKVNADDRLHNVGDAKQPQHRLLSKSQVFSPQVAIKRACRRHELQRRPRAMTAVVV